jgi:hypothetical protein
MKNKALTVQSMLKMTLVARADADRRRDPCSYSDLSRRPGTSH